jgi:hypothetical protein
MQRSQPPRLATLGVTLIVLLSACTSGPAPATPAVASAGPSTAPSIAVVARPAPSTPLATATVTPVVTTPSASASVEPTPEPTLDSGTAGPGCGTGQAGAFAHSGGIPRTLKFGGATVEFTNLSISMRNGTYEASDSVPGGIGLTPDEIRIRVSPGEHVILRGDGLPLTSVHAAVVPWRTVIFGGGIAESPAKPVVLVWRLRADGSISVTSPTKVSEYMVEIFPSWRTECLEGSGTAYARLVVG